MKNNNNVINRVVYELSKKKKTIKVDIYQSFLSHNDSYHLLSYDTYNHSNGK